MVERKVVTTGKSRVERKVAPMVCDRVARRVVRMVNVGSIRILETGRTLSMLVRRRR